MTHAIVFRLASLAKYCSEIKKHQKVTVPYPTKSDKLHPAVCFLLKIPPIIACSPIKTDCWKVLLMGGGKKHVPSVSTYIRFGEKPLLSRRRKRWSIQVTSSISRSSTSEQHLFNQAAFAVLLLPFAATFSSGDFYLAENRTQQTAKHG